MPVLRLFLLGNAVLNAHYRYTSPAYVEAKLSFEQSLKKLDSLKADDDEVKQLKSACQLALAEANTRRKD